MDLAKIKGKYIDSFEFSKAVYKEAFALPDDEVINPKGAAQKLLWEILPIVLLSQHIRNPELQVDVLWFDDSGQRDGKIRLRGKPVEIGWVEPEYFVEVTTALAPQDHYRREESVKYGFTFVGDNNFEKQDKKGSISRSQPQVREGGTHIERLKEWIEDCITKKLAKNYPTPCILVINIRSEGGRLTLEDWVDVQKFILDKNIKHNFDRIYAIDVYENQVAPLCKFKSPSFW
jgi:hypothetical protein